MRNSDSEDEHDSKDRDLISFGAQPRHQKKGYGTFDNCLQLSPQLDEQSDSELEFQDDSEREYVRHFAFAPDAEVLREIAQAATVALHEQFRLIRLYDQRTKLGKKGSKKHRALSEEIRKLKDRIEIVRRRHYLILRIEEDRNRAILDPTAPQEPEQGLTGSKQPESLLDQVDPQQAELLVRLHADEATVPSQSFYQARGGVRVRHTSESLPKFVLESEESTKETSPPRAENQQDSNRSPPPIPKRRRVISISSNVSGDNEENPARDEFGLPREGPANMNTSSGAFGRPELPIGSLPDHLYPKQFTLGDKKRPFSLFLRDFEALTRAHDWRPATACRWLPVWLGGDARVRYSTLPDWIKEGGDYPTLIAHLTDLFNPPAEAGFALQRFHTVPRGKDETLETYSDKLNMLLRQAEPNLSGKARAKFVMNRILSGASREIQLAFATAGARPETLREFIESATAIEDTAKRADATVAAGSLAVVRETDAVPRPTAGIEGATTQTPPITPRIPDYSDVPIEGCLGCGSRDGHKWRNCPESKQPSWLTGWRIRSLLNMVRNDRDRDRSQERRPDRTVGFQPADRQFQGDRSQFAPRRDRFSDNSSRPTYDPRPPFPNGGRSQTANMDRGPPARPPSGFMQRWRSRPQGDTLASRQQPQAQQRPFDGRDRGSRPWTRPGDRNFNPNRRPLLGMNPREAFGQQGNGNTGNGQGNGPSNYFQNSKNGFSNQFPRFRR